MGKGIVTAMGAQVGQSTPGTQALFGMAAGRGRAVSRRKRVGLRPKRKAPRTTRGKQSRKRAGKARLVKGSRAAKAYMAKIRRKRRK
jgi:hypothetical protein